MDNLNVLRRDERRSRSVFGRVVSVLAGRSLSEIAEPELDVEIGGSGVQNADRLRDDEARRPRYDEWHGTGFAGKIAPAAIVAAELHIAGVFARHPLVIRGELGF